MWKFRIILTVLFLFAVSSPPKAEAENRALKQTGVNEKRTAVVIGNSAYSDAPLKNPVNDAKVVSAALRKLNFQVYDYYDLNQNEIKRAVERFSDPANTGGTALFYYAGHGVQSGGYNYLVPVNAEIRTEADVEFESVNLNRVLAKMEEAGNRVNIVILDACRNNPFARSYRSASNGLASVDAPMGSFVVYATAPGQVAGDGSGDNGIFTSALLKVLTNTKGITIEQVFKYVRSEVRAATNGQQIPWTSSSLEGNFYFNPTSDGSMTLIQPAPVPAAPAPVISETEGSYTDRLTGMKFTKVPAGCFRMGSAPGEPYASGDETPYHRVCLGEYYIGTYEVTQAEWTKVMGINPSHFQSCGGDCPVEHVSWNDAQAFVERLNKKTGKSYRLPTEAEWEFAAKDRGQTDRTPADVNAYAWFKPNADGKTHIKGSKQPTKLGVYDMLGNVEEWCQDWYGSSFYAFAPQNNPKGPEDGSRKIVRGGSWIGGPDKVRLSNRRQVHPDSTNPFAGFRLAFTE